ncbi:MAG: ribonuclease P protein component [Patescibacteria group bacterium]
MLAKKFRLPIQTVIGKKGKILKDSYFLLNVMPNLLSYSRYGMVISKKVLTKATERNRIRRKLFSVIEKNFLEKQKNLRQDFLIIISPNIKKITDDEISADLEKLLNKI